jgi:hypothetical protein
VDLRHHDPSERIHDRRIHVHDVEFCVEFVITEEIHAQVLPELFKVPGKVLAWPMAGKVVTGDVGDGLGVDADNLRMRWSETPRNEEGRRGSVYVSVIRGY